MNMSDSLTLLSPCLPPISGVVRKSFPCLAQPSPVRQRRAVVLPVEDGGGDAVWGWSSVLDLHK